MQVPKKEIESGKYHPDSDEWSLSLLSFESVHLLKKAATLLYYYERDFSLCKFPSSYLLIGIGHCLLCDNLITGLISLSDIHIYNTHKVNVKILLLCQVFAFGNVSFLSHFGSLIRANWIFLNKVLLYSLSSFGPHKSKVFNCT